MPTQQEAPHSRSITEQQEAAFSKKQARSSKKHHIAEARRSNKQQEATADCRHGDEGIILWRITAIVIVEVLVRSMCAVAS